MRHTWMLLAGTALALTACESSNHQYNLSGDLNQDQRAKEYSDTNTNASQMDADRCEDMEKAMEPSDGD